MTTDSFNGPLGWFVAKVVLPFLVPLLTAAAIGAFSLGFGLNERMVAQEQKMDFLLASISDFKREIQEVRGGAVPRSEMVSIYKRVERLETISENTRDKIQSLELEAARGSRRGENQ